MKSKLIIYPLILATIIISCWPAETDPANECIKQLKATKGIDLNKYKNIIFIPETGCAGCISQSLDFLVREHNKLFEMKYLFVFVDVLDKKRIRNKIGFDLYNSKSICFLNACWLGHQLTKPMELKLSDGKPIQISEWNPQKFKTNK